MNPSANRYFVVYKPYDMVSQFLSPHAVRLLGDLDFPFPEGTHAVGRLDKLSEGLLILTTDKKLTRLLFLGAKPHRRTYLVQVNSAVHTADLETLRKGISFKIKGALEYVSTPYEVNIIDAPANIPAPAIELPSQMPFSWLQITLTEGKFHQVRKMVAGISHRVHRLIRISIEDLELDGLQPGEVREVEEQALFEKLGLNRD